MKALRRHSEAWAEAEFGQAALGDARRRRRLVHLGAAAARKPAGRLTHVFGKDAAGRQGAYKLLEKGQLGQGAVAAAAAHGAWGRVARGCPYVVAPLDQSALSLPAARTEAGFGPVGTQAAPVLGLQAMTGLLCSPGGVPLGLGAQTLWARAPAPSDMREAHKRARPLEAKETRYWLQVLEALVQGRAEAGRADVGVWMQLDAGADAEPVLRWSAGAPPGVWVTVRCGQDRSCLSPQEARLWGLVDALPRAGGYALRVPQGPKRTGRRARIAVRFSPVVLRLTEVPSGRETCVELFLVHAAEEGTCPPGEAPIEWMLLTNRPVPSLKVAREVLGAYRLRWRIEEVHRAWKSGCGVEDSQLAAGAFAPWATLLMCVAVRAERLKRLSREAPTTPAAAEFSDVEVRALLLLWEDPRRLAPDAPPPTLGEAVDWLARIGGYTGKSSGGPPGTTVISRGLEELTTATRVLKAQEALKAHR